jgi:hypothetical protein
MTLKRQAVGAEEVGVSTAALSTEAPLELDHRAGDGLQVWLLWTASKNRLFLLVHDAKLDESFEVDVDGAEALDAFRHPYAYAAIRRMRYVAVPADRSAAAVSSSRPASVHAEKGRSRSSPSAGRRAAAHRDRACRGPYDPACGRVGTISSRLDCPEQTRWGQTPPEGCPNGARPG